MALIRGFKAAGIVACFDETPGGGAMFDINAARNAPAKSPAAYLDKLAWHSEAFQYEVALETTKVVNHTALATGLVFVGVGGTPSVGINVLGNIRVTNILLASHGLSMTPTAMAALNARMLPSGFIIQTHSSGGLRTVSSWVDNDNVYLREVAISTTVALPATSLTYDVMVFRSRAPDLTKAMFSSIDGDMHLAWGIIDGSKKYAKQVAVGEAPYSINLGPTLDCNDGRVRSATGGIVVSEAGYAGAMPTPPFRNIGL